VSTIKFVQKEKICSVRAFSWALYSYHLAMLPKIWVYCNLHCFSIILTSEKTGRRTLTCPFFCFFYCTNVWKLWTVFFLM